ncbi:CRAL/TRIO domain-containing protein, partial [Rhodofomes roseus]
MAPSKDKQAEIVEQFREQLDEQDLLPEDDIGTDDASLLRFLRARQFDLKAATTMWENCQNWRKTVEGIGIDELYRRLDPYDYPERAAVFECWPLWFHKTDKKGRPLNIHHFGGINMPELYKHITPEKFWQTIVVNAESLTREVLPASARAAGRQIDGTFVIVDLKGFGLSQFWQMKNLARDSFQISQDYFPETMAQLAIINAPASFTTIWGFIKPWLAKETLAKIDILGSDYKDVLLEQIPAENLPESLGGTCTCAEAGGCKLSNAGPWMQHRAERRDKWLRGERKRIGLGLEGEDEDDGVRGIGSGEQTKAATNQLEKQAEGVAAIGQAAEKQPAEVNGSALVSPEDTQTSSPESVVVQSPSQALPEKIVKSVREVYEHHPETREPQMGD